MSNPFTKKQIQDQFASLPTDMQQVISSADTASLIQSIGAKHGLRIDAVGTLVEYSGLIMLGLIESDEFVNSLVRETGVNREQAANMAMDVDNQVFSQVRNSLRKAQYKSTSQTRFEQSNDFQNPAPAQSSTPSVDDVLQNIGAAPAPELPNNDIVDQPIADDIPMASTDYDPNNFGSVEPVQNISQAPPVSAYREPAPVSTTGPSALDATAEKLDSAFETSPSGSVSIELNKNPVSNAVNPSYNSASVEQEVNRSIASEVVKGMPAAMQDAYKTGQAAAPAPQVEPAAIKDFQTRLEEKIAQTDTSAVDNDPYKESI